MDKEKILYHLEKKGFYIIKNFLIERDFLIMKKFWLSFFQNEPKSKKNNNIHKTGVILGDTNYLANSKINSKENHMMRFVQYLWNNSENQLTLDYAIRLHKVRNMLTNKDENYGLNFSKDRIAMYLQTNYYPPNKGFMTPHVDGYKKEIMLNITFNLTFKNLDFEDGGIQLVKNNKLINLDDLVQPTDALLFDGNLKHGVKKIVSKNKVGRIGVFPIISKFNNYEEIPLYLKKIAHSHGVIKRIFKIKKREKLPNEL
jgi:hypothetical protein